MENNHKRKRITMELKDLLEKLSRRENLNIEEAQFAIEQIASEVCVEQPAAIGALLALLASKGETAIEVAAFAKHMRTQYIPVVVKSQTPTLDIVGTGGDGANTVNISTAAAVLSSACGALVAKHGARSVSSRSGSADVLEELGIPMLTPEKIAPCLEDAKIAFMYAPNFHPAMRFVVPIRKSMRIRTVFNILGPLLNPAGSTHVVIGVYTPSLIPIFGETLQALGVEHGLVIHCAGLDELNTIGEPAQIAEVKKGEPMKQYTLDHKSLGIPDSTLEDLKGGDATENAKILKSVFKGGESSRGPIGTTIAYNAGAGLYVYGLAPSIKEGYEIAMKTLESGKALETLNKWTSVAQKLHEN